MPDMDPLKNPENGKMTVISNPPEGSFAAVSDITQIEAQIQKAEDIVDANSADPVARALVNGSEHRKRTKTVTVDMFAVGDTVYHRKHHEEAKVIETSADRIRVRFKNKDKTWCKPENLVKLD